MEESLETVTRLQDRSRTIKFFWFFLVFFKHGEQESELMWFSSCCLLYVYGLMGFKCSQKLTIRGNGQCHEGYVLLRVGF